MKKLFCKHRYIKIGYIEECSNNLRYSMRKYKCEKCQKEIWVDGRNDPYFR